MYPVKRVGILGGTFDPPHMGHLILGEYASDALQLTQMLFVPAGDPPHKQAEAKTLLEHRLTMLKLALADNEHFQMSRADVDRPGPHYSVDMVQIIRDSYPDAEVYFVMGGDSLRDLPKWYRPQEFIRLCKLAVMRRPGDTASAAMHENVLPGLAERVTMIDAPLIDISGIHIRARVQAGQSIRYLVPESVRDYIQMNQLYNL
jgi:nicotinate-nucleotide adenylyltransferase